ncbi:MAG: Gfo/Idh/MocA family oxidoreductase [Chitinophagaceae bacterium]
MDSPVQYMINLYRNKKKLHFLERPSVYKNKYAIIGTGLHNTTNIYPCLWHLGIPIKKIFSRNKSNAEKASARWPRCKGTDNLAEIFDDPTISSVFVITEGGSTQAELTKELLQRNKNVFVEKPLGFSVSELISLIQIQKTSICQIGLQRRFAPATQILKTHCKSVQTYNYKFYTGRYPEGNSIYNLFIHPIDYVVQLFGKATVEYISLQTNGTAETFFLILNHNSIKGMLELSTNYNWQQAADEISINTSKKIFSAVYPGHVSAISKPTTLLKIPVEKVFRRPSIQEIFLDHNSFVPDANMNSLNLMGFYAELFNFANAVEKNVITDYQKLESLLPAYEILEQMKKIAK